MTKASKPRDDGEGGSSVASIQGVNGAKLPPLDPHVAPASILTPERLEAARKAAATRSELASGRMVTGNLSSHVDAELTQKEYTSVPDPENPGYMTNGLPVLPDTSEVVNGIRYSIPMWKPSLVRGGRVMVRRSREPGEKGKVLEVTRIWDRKSSTVLRFDGEAQCVHWNTTGACADPRHTHARRRNVEQNVLADEEQRVF